MFNMLNNKNLAVYGDEVSAGGVLGHLLWYTVPEQDITRAKILDAITAAGIDIKHVPMPISPRDAFRRATRIQVPRCAEKTAYLVREVGLENGVLRHIVREQKVDGAMGGRRLEYRALAALQITDDNPTVNVDILDYSEMDDECRRIVDQVRARYDVTRDHYDASAIRRMVAQILSTCRPIAVRPSGGVHFVPQKYESTVYAVAELFPKIAGEGQFWFLPVIDAKNQREMVAKSLDTHVETEAAAIVAELGRVMKGRQEISATLTEKYVRRVQEIAAAVKEYEDMLETKAITAKSHLQLAEQQIRSLLLSDTASFTAAPTQETIFDAVAV